jgi:hypothetical protein
MAMPSRKESVLRAAPKFAQATLGDGEESSKSESANGATNLLSKVNRVMFLDLRSPQDGIKDRLRKIVVSWGLPLTLLPLAFFVYLCAEAMQTADSKTGVIVSAVAMLVFIGTWCSVNVYTRLTRRLPEVVMDIWLFMTMLGVLLLAISLAEYPTPQIAFFLAALAFLCDTRRLPWQLIVCAAIYSMTALSQAFAGLSRQPEIHMPIIHGAYWATLNERIAYQISTIGVALIIAAMLYMQNQERASVSVAEAAAARLSKAVTDELIRFDTEAAVTQLKILKIQNYDGAGAYIKPESLIPSSLTAMASNANFSSAARRGGVDAGNVNPAAGSPVSSVQRQNSAPFSSSVGSDHQTGSNRNSTPGSGPASPPSGVMPDRKDPAYTVEVDGRLIESFELLIDHLERFRPHLPNWLLSAAAHQGNQMADGHMRQDAYLEDPDLLIDESLDEEPSLNVDSIDNTPRMQSQRSSSTGGGGSSPKALNFGFAKRGTVGLVTNVSMPGGMISPRGLSHRLSQHSSHSGDMYFRIRNARISVAWMDFSRMIPADSSQLGTNLDAVCALVDGVHDAAETTYAAIHTFVGDSILASWNTARVGAQVECKCARFLAAVRDIVSSLDGAMKVTGAAMTGDAQVQMGGLANKQHALCVSFHSWRRAFRQLSAFSRIVGAILIDDTTFASASYTVEARMVDYVTVSKDAIPFASSTIATPTPMPLHPVKPVFGAALGDAPLTLCRVPSNHQMAITNASFGNQPLSASSGPSRTMAVYEVLRDLSNLAKDKTNNGIVLGTKPEEWMYTLQKSERKTTVAMKEAIDLAKQDKFMLARDLLEAALRLADATPKFGQRDNDSEFSSPGSSLSGFPQTLAMRRGQSGHGIMDACNTLPIHVGSTQKRLLKKLEVFASAEGKTWAMFPEDLTPFI